MKDYVKIFTKEKMIENLTLHTMKFFESSLPSDSFIRVHKSYIVNASAIKSIAGNELNCDWPISIGSSYKDQLMRSIQSR
ncbi:MAG: LytTR family transcriptional regulator DNA-binding domain-containing protein [Bacteroidetes bacterium]|nr:LytTR family transcriptional regulator DNA-binding domain-containing protein [Bacteroidota bacterium]